MTPADRAFLDTITTLAKAVSAVPDDGSQKSDRAFLHAQETLHEALEPDAVLRLVALAEQAPASECEWVNIDPDRDDSVELFTSRCGQTFTIEELFGVSDPPMAFCLYCGGKLLWRSPPTPEAT